ncbi:tetratricopeptide repeat protein [Lichenicola sp.]|uniref:tetratricopeptide repeat protein n=1 Tax=Lichenicola sp. TaxID=2804529 RepID=UPI003B00E3F1
MTDLASRQSRAAKAADALAAADVHRQAQRYDEAEAVVSEALRASPDHPGLLICSAWVAQQSGRPEEALERWARVRIIARTNPVGYSAAVHVHHKLGQVNAADALAMDGLARFPDDSALKINYAWSAHHARNWAQAAERWELFRTYSPDVKLGYLQGAVALREGGDLPAAEALVGHAFHRFPDDGDLLTSYAAMASQGRNWTQAVRRWRWVRIKFPENRVAYLLEARALIRLKSFEEAELVVLAGLKLFPADGELFIEAARCSKQLRQHSVALERWQQAYHLASHIPSAGIGFAEALTLTGETSQADAILADLSARFPKDAATAIAFARLAVERSDWAAAETRWRAAHQDHSDNRAFAVAANEAAMKALLSEQHDLAKQLSHLADTKMVIPASSASDQDAIPEIDPRELLMKFESLGYNCEFGIVQRHFGAEPLSLLRWTATEPDLLAEALNNRLEGVGLPEYTRIVLDSDYRTKDTRYFMLMHTFILPSQATPEELLPKFCKRLQYLRSKLLDDLRAAEKIFLYKAVDPLTDAQIMPLWHAVSACGPNTLVVARIADETNAPGTVRVVEPGLIVGYFDRTSTTDPSFDIWLAICRRSHALWQASHGAHKIGELAAAAA